MASALVAAPAPTPTPAAVVDGEASPSLPADKKNSIFFFGTEGPHGFLSNFSLHSFSINGVTWKTVEHYYQAQKFLGSVLETQIRDCEDPAEARKIAKKAQAVIRADWNENKEQVMLAGLIAKFSQNNDAARGLLDTQNAFLVEHSKKDSYWGDGHSDHGLNRQGALLMQVRQMIREKLGIPEPTEEYKAPSELKSDAQLRKMLAELMEKSDAIDEGIISTQAPRTKRKIRRRTGAASKPFRYADGTSVFEKGSESGEVNVVDTEIVIPSKSLTPAARTVAFLYQFEKKKAQEKARESAFVDPDIEEDEEDDEHSELELEYLPPKHETILDKQKNPQIDHLGLMEETEMALVMATTIEDKNSDDFKAFVIQLESLRAELVRAVYNENDESVLSRLLNMISNVDSLVEPKDEGSQKE